MTYTEKARSDAIARIQIAAAATAAQGRDEVARLNYESRRLSAYYAATSRKMAAFHQEDAAQRYAVARVLMGIDV